MFKICTSVFATYVGIYSIARDILKNCFCLALGITQANNNKSPAVGVWCARDPLHVDRIPGAPKHTGLETEPSNHQNIMAILEARSRSTPEESGWN